MIWMGLRIGNGISAFFLLLFEEVNNDNIQFNFSEKMFCFVCSQRALSWHKSYMNMNNCCFMCVPQSGVEFDALSDGVPYPTPLHQTSRGCGQLFTVLLELPAPPWVGAHMYTHSTGLYCVALGATGCVVHHENTRR